MRARPLMPMPPIPTKWIRAGAGGSNVSVLSDWPSLPCPPLPSKTGAGRTGRLPSPRSERPGTRVGVPSGPGAGDEGFTSGWRSTPRLVHLDGNVDTPLLLLQRAHSLTEAVAPVELIPEKPKRRAAGREQDDVAWF